MAKLAIVRIGGAQHKVQPGQEIAVDSLEGDKGRKLILEQVLLVAEGEKVLVGQPRVTGAKVQAVIEEQVRGKKIRVATYKAKSRYRKVKGFRAELTRLKVEAVEVGEKNVNGKAGR